MKTTIYSIIFALLNLTTAIQIVSSTQCSQIFCGFPAHGDCPPGQSCKFKPRKNSWRCYDIKNNSTSTQPTVSQTPSDINQPPCFPECAADEQCVVHDPCQGWADLFSCTEQLYVTCEKKSSPPEPRILENAYTCGGTSIGTCPDGQKCYNRNCGNGPRPRNRTPNYQCSSLNRCLFA